MPNPEPTRSSETRCDLAEHLMARCGDRSWWGRHYVVAFGLLPLLVYPVLWALLLVLQMALAFALEYGWNMKKVHVAFNNPVAFHHFTHGFQSWITSPLPWWRCSSAGWRGGRR